MNILFCGVGGQGILVASDITANAALIYGLDVKKSEVHGMAQRGGAVVSAVKFGKKVYSPLIGVGEADIIVAFEKLEALRNIEYLSPAGTYIVGDYELPPLAVIMENEEYPKNIIQKIKKVAKKVVVVNVLELAKKVGNIRVVNTAFLGILSKELDFHQEIWFKAIEMRLPQKVIDINKKAFLLGSKYGKEEK